MKTTKIKNAVAMFCNLCIAMFTLMCILQFFKRTGDGNMQVSGTRCFRFFTIDSNVLLALTSLIALFFNMKSLKTGREEMPLWASTSKLIGSTAATVTFLTAMCFLGPTQGYDRMLAGSNLYLHLLNPVLAILSICFFNGGFKIPKRLAALGVLPTAVYGAVYMGMVLFTKQWEDFYGFNRGGKWFISLPCMLLATLGIALGLNALRNLCWKKKLNR